MSECEELRNRIATYLEEALRGAHLPAPAFWEMADHILVLLPQQPKLERAATEAELLELRAKLDAYKQLDAAQCAQLTSYRKEDRRDHAARATLESEREANRLLTEENERLRAKLAAGPMMPVADLYELCEATKEQTYDSDNAFNRGRYFEAKHIAKAVMAAGY